MIVVDASIALAWSHRDEATPAIDVVLRRVIEEGGVVPAIWPAEIANALQMAVRRKRIDVQLRDLLLADFRRLTIEIEHANLQRTWIDALTLSERHRLSVDDATYLEVATRRKLALATKDAELITAARAEGLEILP